MAKDPKQLIFGIHGATLCDFHSFQPIGEELDVLGDLTLDVAADIESLYGGSHLWAVAGEVKTFACEGSLDIKEYPEELAEYLVAGAGTKTAASATGGVTTIANRLGTSVFSATTGIASVGLKSGEGAELKGGMYVVVAATASTVDVYAVSTANLKRGTDLTLTAGSMKIAAGLSIETDTAVEVTNTGVELTGGSGTIGMTAGDTAFYRVYPPHNGVETITMGQAESEPKRVALMLTAQNRTTGEMFDIFCPNALVLGLPLGLKEKAFQTGGIKIGIFTDESLDYAIETTSIKGTNIQA